MTMILCRLGPKMPPQERAVMSRNKGCFTKLAVAVNCSIQMNPTKSSVFSYRHTPLSTLLKRRNDGSQDCTSIFAQCSNAENESQSCCCVALRYSKKDFVMAALWSSSMVGRYMIIPIWCSKAKHGTAQHIIKMRSQPEGKKRAREKENCCILKKDDQICSMGG